jgi:hypothetical protein
MMQTCKILAVAVTAVGCSRAVPPQAPQAPTTAVAETTLPSPTPPVADTTPPALTAAAVQRRNAQAEEAKLYALRDELVPLAMKKIEKEKDHFRPLCDADGYPLVGNVGANKPGPNGSVSVQTEPSAFCELVRAKAKRPSSTVRPRAAS